MESGENKISLCGHWLSDSHSNTGPLLAKRWHRGAACFCQSLHRLRGTRWRSWRKVAGSILNGVIGIFQWHNPSGRIMTLESNQPLTEMSTRNISCGVNAAGAWADNLITFVRRVSWNLRVSTLWITQGMSRLLMGFLRTWQLLNDSVLRRSPAFISTQINQKLWEVGYKIVYGLT
jgi:hypothetical protein